MENASHPLDLKFHENCAAGPWYPHRSKNIWNLHLDPASGALNAAICGNITFELIPSILGYAVIFNQPSRLGRSISTTICLPGWLKPGGGRSGSTGVFCSIIFKISFTKPDISWTEMVPDGGSTKNTISSCWICEFEGGLGRYVRHWALCSLPSMGLWYVFRTNFKMNRMSSASGMVISCVFWMAFRIVSQVRVCKTTITYKKTRTVGSPGLLTYTAVLNHHSFISLLPRRKRNEGQVHLHSWPPRNPNISFTSNCTDRGLTFLIHHHKPLASSDHSSTKIPPRHLLT